MAMSEAAIVIRVIFVVFIDAWIYSGEGTPVSAENFRTPCATDSDDGLEHTERS